MLDQRISRRALLSGSAAAGAAALFADPAVLAARPPSASVDVRPYRVHVPEAAIADLRRRIRDTRWPDRETASDRAQGAQLADMQGLLRYWGGDYDWRRAEARLNALPQFIDDDRRRRDPFHPRPLAPSERTARARLARLARLRVRAARADRSAHRSDGSWRPGGGCVRRGDPVLARIWLFGPAGRDRLGAGPDRPGLGRADEAARLSALRLPGRRLGLGHRRGDGAAGAGGPARESTSTCPPPFRPRSARRSPAPGRRPPAFPRRRARRSKGCAPSSAEGIWLTRR